ncbi:MAG: PEP_CTERM-anchored TLD domain-containing protein [Opitutaceae bacterium]
MNSYFVRRFGWLVSACLLYAAHAPVSAQIIGGSSLLTNSDVDQLAAWLGEGPIQLTNVFSRVTGDGQNSTHFHSAVDGIGRTISVLNVNDNGHDVVIGGYNPYSWEASQINNGYRLTPLDADRTGIARGCHRSTRARAAHIHPAPGVRSYH